MTTPGTDARAAPELGTAEMGRDAEPTAVGFIAAPTGAGNGPFAGVTAGDDGFTVLSPKAENGFAALSVELFDGPEAGEAGAEADTGLAAPAVGAADTGFAETAGADADTGLAAPAGGAADTGFAEPIAGAETGAGAALTGAGAGEASPGAAHSAPGAGEGGGTKPSSSFTGGRAAGGVPISPSLVACCSSIDPPDHRCRRLGRRALTLTVPHQPV